MYAVIRIRGSVGMNRPMKDALKMLRLNRKMHCVLINDNDVNRGMIKKVKDYVTWGEINEEILKLLLQKRARKVGNKRLENAEAEVLFDNIMNEKKMVLDVNPVFRLTPPSKGFKLSIKQHSPKGELGYRGEKINDLLKRMI